MADLSDLTGYLKQTALSAVYPGGTSQPSIAGIDCTIEEGWPNPAQLELDIAGQEKNASGATVPRPGGVCAHVSVFPMPGTGVKVYQILDQTYTIKPPSYGMTFTLEDDTITVTGEPKPGEYLTLICDDAVVCSQSGATTQELLAALAEQAQVNYPGASSTDDTLTVPVGHSLVVRQGGTAVQGKVTHRQRQCIMVTVWAPTPETRNSLAIAVDGLIKQNNKITLPDTSQAMVIYDRTNVTDLQETVGIYRRDLIYDVEYATLETFTAYVITSTRVSIAKPDNTAVATAIT